MHPHCTLIKISSSLFTEDLINGHGTHAHKSNVHVCPNVDKVGCVLVGGQPLTHHLGHLVRVVPVPHHEVVFLRHEVPLHPYLWGHSICCDIVDIHGRIVDEDLSTGDKRHHGLLLHCSIDHCLPPALPGDVGCSVHAQQLLPVPRDLHPLTVHHGPLATHGKCRSIYLEPSFPVGIFDHAVITAEGEKLFLQLEHRLLVADILPVVPDDLQGAPLVTSHRNIVIC